VHTPPMFDTIFNLFKSFAKGKIRERVSLIFTFQFIAFKIKIASFHL